MTLRAEASYRPCVGIAVFNCAGAVFVGRRRAGSAVKVFEPAWQMPQGGIDPGETPLEAAVRELYEETNIRSVSPLGEADEWFCYDIPPRLAGQAWKGRYRGQSQKWLAFRFDGSDDEIDVDYPGGGRHKPEFSEWRWDRLDRVADLVVPFKREVYGKVAKVFSPFARPANATGAAGSEPLQR